MLGRRRQNGPIRRAPAPAVGRGGGRGRHGRGTRSSVAGPFLPMLTGRAPRFELAVVQAAVMLRSMHPELLAGLRLSVADVPEVCRNHDGIDRWHALPPDRVVLFRVPIDRLVHLHCPDPAHYREHVERCLAEAIADLHGLDPWEVLPERDEPR